MRLHLVVGLAAVLGAAGCAQTASTGGDDKPELTPELKSLILSQTPSDLPNPTLIDFGGAAELIGYSVTPERLAAPGSKLTIKSFWRCTAKLGEGYQLYTELVTPSGKRFELEGSGALRKGALTPASWEPGKIYIDELEANVPEELQATRFSIVTGLKTQPVAPVEPEAEPEAEDAKDAKDAKKDEPAAGTFGSVYLTVVSGLADAKHGGILATLETGVTPGAKRARGPAPLKRVGLPGGAQPGGKVPTMGAPLRPSAPPAQPAK